MKTAVLLFMMFSVPVAITAQVKGQPTGKPESTETGDNAIPAYVIERTIPGAGQLTSQQLREISQVSCSAIDSLGSGIEWLHSYVTADKVYCVYRAANQELLRKHAAMGGFPIDGIAQVATVIDPTTAKPDQDK